jgi:hypothetical protein
MSVGFDPTADFADITDGLEAVTVQRRGTSATVAVANALQRAVTTQESFISTDGSTPAASFGKITSADTVWHLPIEEIATSPRVGDVIIDSASKYWTVLLVAEQTLTARWRCTCRDIVAQFCLDDTMTIEKATYSKGTGGAAEAKWPVWKSGVRGRIQTMSTNEDNDAGAKRTEVIYQIMLEKDFKLGTQHRIRDRQNNEYRIRKAINVEDVSRPFTVEAVTWR